MAIKQTIGNFLARVAEALGSSGAGASSDDELGYRRLSDDRRLRDLKPMDRDRMLRISHFLYDSNPMAQWLIEQPINLILGDELGFSVEIDATAAGIKPEDKAELEKKIKGILSRFWDHPAFSIRMRADELIVGLKVSGELCLPIAGRNEIDGLPAIDYVDSEAIEEVRPVKGSSLTHDLVFLKSPDVGGEAPPPKAVIRMRDGQLSGDVFFWRNSRLPNSMRGRTELHRQHDWIDGTDQFLFSRIDRAILANNIVHDVTLTGANDQMVREKAKEIRRNPPNKPGTIRVHNDKEVWKTISPELGAADASDEYKLVRGYVLGSKGIPESWFSDGGSVTRTTADAQNDVALMSLKRLRKEIKGIFDLMLAYAYGQVRDFYKFPLEGVKLSVDLPPIGERDISRLGGVIQNIEASLELAVQEGLISKRTAQKVFLHFVDRLGVPVDPDDERSQIDVEATDREKERIDEQNRLATERLAGELDREPAPATGA